jgi:hypothetical protein
MSATDAVTMIEAQYVDGKFLSSPFDNNPPWMKTFMEHKLLQLAVLPEYAVVWVAHTNKGTIVVEEGDKITNDMMFGLVVEKQRKNQMTYEGLQEILRKAAEPEEARGRGRPPGAKNKPKAKA